MYASERLIAKSIKGELIDVTSEGIKIKLSDKSPKGIPDTVGYYEDDTTFILTDQFALLTFLRNLFELQHLMH